MIRLRILLYYDDKTRELLECSLFSNASESSFVRDIINVIGEKGKGLIMMDVYQIDVEYRKDMIDFLRVRNGKYYFNTEKNSDADTLYWRNFLDRHYQESIPK